MKRALHIGAFVLLCGVAVLCLAAVYRSAPRAQGLVVAEEPSATAAPAFPLHARILFGGDMMFDRSVRSTTAAHGGDFIFSCIDQTLAGADLTVANLEGPITDNPSVSMGSVPGASDNYRFTFASSTAALLAAHRISLVSLGNNHILNFGYDGVLTTKQYLQMANVGYFGDPPQYGSKDEDVQGVPLTFINYNEFGGSATTTLNQISDARGRGRLPIVFAHWGIEYATTSPARVQTLAHAFADAGAALIVGAHPHVVEDHEDYRGVPIYYSLGNFIFDQYFSDNVTHGLLLEADITPAGVSNVQEIPIAIGTDRRPCPVN